MATIVDNGNSQSNIKLTMINTKIPIEANYALSTLKDYIQFGGPVLWVLLYPLYPGGPPDIDGLKYPLLNSVFRVIKTLATGVNNNYRQSYIKLAIINIKIPSKAVSIVFDIERLYNFCRVNDF